MKTMRLVTISAALSSCLMAGLIDHIGVRGGYSQAIMQDHSSTKVDADESKTGGLIYDLSAAFNVTDEGFFQSFKPYVDFTGRHYSDRDAQTFGVGLHHDFGSVLGLAPFAAAGIGYAQMRWIDSPLRATAKSDKAMNSAVASLHGGVALELSDWIDATFSLRGDWYELTTQHETEDHSTEQVDRFALSALAGLRFRFEHTSAPVPQSEAATPPPAAEPTPVAAPVVAPVVPAEPCDLAGLKRRFHFDFDSAVLKEEAKSVIDATVTCLKDHPDTRIEFEGHTDSTGAAAYNQKLSLKRSSAAGEYTHSKGLDAARIVSSGKGETKPAADNAIAEGRALNRRVDLYFIDSITPVLFDYNSASLSGKVSKLEPLLERMRSQSEASVIIVGHTDDVGSQRYNLKLSKARAEAIKAFLIGNGIDAKRIETRADGEAKPAASNADESGRTQNRRAEMNVRH
ncbi:MAG: OmpA family protein [Campylobacterales bacterium]|nr:OmpA family protein [Campylobacterales bacterium]